MSESLSTPPARTRRWLRFSMRTLLVLVVLVAGIAGWFALKIHRGKEQQTAAAEIRRRGGTAMHCPMYGPQQHEEPPEYYPEWLLEKLGDDYFATINYVSLNSSEFTDQDLTLLAAMPELRAVFLSKAQVSDAGLVQLARLRQLEQLSLAKTKLTDAGLAPLGRLLQLESLDLSGTAITDTGLKQLYPLKHLSRLNLTETQVTDGGVAALIQVLPSLKVTRGESSP